ncbi:unnamed protein product, partial [Prorocentrum cordatum]
LVHREAKPVGAPHGRQPLPEAGPRHAGPEPVAGAPVAPGDPAELLGGGPVAPFDPEDVADEAGSEAEPCRRGHGPRRARRPRRAGGHAEHRGVEDGGAGSHLPGLSVEEEPGHGGKLEPARWLPVHVGARHTRRPAVAKLPSASGAHARPRGGRGGSSATAAADAPAQPRRGHRRPPLAGRRHGPVMIVRPWLPSRPPSAAGAQSPRRPTWQRATGHSASAWRETAASRVARSPEVSRRAPLPSGPPEAFFGTPARGGARGPWPPTSWLSRFNQSSICGGVSLSARAVLAKPGGARPPPPPPPPPPP